MAPKRKMDPSKKIPEGTSRSLKGLKLFFTGSFETMTQDQAEKAAKKYGGSAVISFKFAEADYVVVGTQPTQKRLGLIAEHDKETLTEDDFLRVIKTGELAMDSAAANGTNGADNVGDESEEEAAEDPAPKKAKTSKKKVSTKEAQHTIPDGKPGALRGLKLLFTGTFSIVRNTCIATVDTYGGEIVTEMVDADWIVLGTKPGPQKMDIIQNLGLRTMNEAQFFELVETGELPEEDE